MIFIFTNLLLSSVFSLSFEGSEKFTKAATVWCSELFWLHICSVGFCMKISFSVTLETCLSIKSSFMLTDVHTALPHNWRSLWCITHTNSDDLLIYSGRSQSKYVDQCFLRSYWVYCQRRKGSRKYSHLRSWNQESFELIFSEYRNKWNKWAETVLKWLEYSWMFCKLMICDVQQMWFKDVQPNHVKLLTFMIL